MTRVPVLSFLGNGETTNRHLAVGFWYGTKDAEIM